MDIMTDILKTEFPIGKESDLPLRFTGMQISTAKNGDIQLSQEAFVMKIEALNGNFNTKTKLSIEDIAKLRQITGQLQWCASQSRPDISFGANTLTSDLENATGERILQANKLVRRLKFNGHLQLTFPRNISPDNSVMLLYTDASFQNLYDGGSQGAYFIIIFDLQSHYFYPISWSSHRIKRVVKSTLAAETLSLIEGLDTALFLNEIMLFLLQKKMKIYAVIDSKQLHDSINSSKCITEKRLRVDISSIKLLKEQGEIEDVKWVSASKQLADTLTKKSAIPESLLRNLESGKIQGSPFD